MLVGAAIVVHTVFTCRSIAEALKFKKQREPFDNEYLLGLLWHQRKHLLLATATLLFCTASNLAAPVLSGMLLECLVQNKPPEIYGQVAGGVRAHCS